MLWKGKDKDYFQKLSLLLTILTLLIVATTYWIVNSKLVKIEKASILQYTQIGWEENYGLFLEIFELTKGQTKQQMEDYLANLKAQEEASNTIEPQVEQESPSENVIDITEVLEEGWNSVEVWPEWIINK